MFKDTARIIGHEALLGLLALPPASTQLPLNLRGQDANGNGALSGAEAVRGPLKLVVPPDLTYAGQVNITLGGKRVEVIPAGGSSTSSRGRRT